MSLVAAYSDSESEEESNETPSIQDNPKEILPLVKSSEPPIVPREESLEYVNNAGNNDNESNTESNLFSILPQPKVKKSELIEEMDDEFVKKDINAKCDNPLAVVKDDEKEKPFKRSALNLPTPSRKTNKKQPVKILIPSLDEIAADSDSDDEMPKNKERPVIKRKSTLFSILPKPRHSVTVGANRNKVFSHQANRPLIPHTLTKKQEAPLKTEPKKPIKKEPSSLVGNISGSDDDDDIESSHNFFSLSSSKSCSINKIPDTVPLTSVEKNSNMPNENSSVIARKNIDSTNLVQNEKNIKTVKKNIEKNDKKASSTIGNSFFSNLYKTDSKKDTESVISKSSKDATTSNETHSTKSHSAVTSSYSSVPKTDSNKKNLAPHSDVTSPYSDVTAPYSSVTAPYSDVTAPYSDVTAPYSDVTAPYSDVTAPYGNMTSPYRNVSGSHSRDNSSIGLNQGFGNEEKKYPSSQKFFTYAYHKKEMSLQPPETEGNTDIDYYNKPNEDLPIEKDALLALQGKKRRKEDINLIDIHQDDIQANSMDILKNLTTENAEQQRLMMAQKEKDQPTSGQKRKHQITYLAYQAKERELLLQQQWAENRQSKRQTQSKYGF